jgi:hypothetical protein
MFKAAPESLTATAGATPILIEIITPEFPAPA